jgi:hypothetical protein
MTDRDTWMGGGLLALLVVGIAVAIVLGFREEAEWERFREEHRCRVVGKERGQVHHAFGPKGQYTPVYSSGRTRWLCDDGVEYTR